MLLLNQIANKGKSGVVKINLPSSGGGEPTTLTGFLSDNVSIRLGNSWQTVLPDTSDLTKFQGAIGSQTITTWLNSSQSVWTGAEPLTVGITFYLFSISESSSIKKDVLKLKKLAVPHREGNASISVHGGYSPDILAKSSATSDIINNDVSGLQKGLISIEVGNQFKLKGMLLVDIVSENSSVEVKNKNPLYIKVTANFKTFMVITDDQLEGMFNN